MAIKAFTRKTSGPTTSDEFLKDYENLLKRNKGGGLFMGYDTSSQTPIYLGTSVADPMGLGQNINTKSQDNIVADQNDISQTVDLFTQVLDSLNDNISSEDAITISDFIDNYFQNELPNLTEDQQKQVLPVLGRLIDRSSQIISNYSNNASAYREGMNSPYTPLLPEYANNQNTQDSYEEGQNFGLLNYQINQTADEALKKATELKDIYKSEYNSKKELLDKMMYDPEYAPLRERNKKYEEAKQRLIDEGKINESGQRLDENGNVNIGYTGTPNTENIGEIIYKAPENDTKNASQILSDWLSSATSKVGEGIKNVRGAVGDTIDSLAYAIPGTSNRKDTGFSEWVAGRDTPHTVSAAEPETAQAGSGLTRLRDDMSYSPTALAGRPDFSQIGLKRSIGNVAGIQDQSAITGNKQVSPDGQSMSGVSRFSQSPTPTSTTLPQFNPQQQESRPSRTFDQSQLGSIVDAMMSKGYSNRAEAEAVARADINRFGNEYLPSGGSSNNVGVGSNQPSTQQSGQQSSNNTSRSNTYTAPTTSNNAMTYSNLSNIGTSNFVMPTVGVGSNQPSTSSSSSNSNSLMSTISNLLANLFRRK